MKMLILLLIIAATKTHASPDCTSEYSDSYDGYVYCDETEEFSYLIYLDMTISECVENDYSPQLYFRLQ